MVSFCTCDKKNCLLRSLIVLFLGLEEVGVTVAVLPRKEVIRGLRDRNKPVILFGESDVEAFRR